VPGARIYVGVTDSAWFDFLREHADLDEVNFWRPGGGTLRAQRGTPFLFKSKAPKNAIGGGGYVEYSEAMTLQNAWEFYGPKNGTDSFATLRSRIERYRKAALTPEDRIGCVLLAQPFFLAPDEWIPIPDDWAANTVAGKYYSLDDAAGAALWKRVAERMLPHIGASLGAPFGGEGAPLLVMPRLGQGTFRKLVLNAYGDRCAVTGERTIPVLQASHIKPFADVREHEVCNGIALRSDIHTLFDRGYVTVTPRHTFRVSARLRDDFSNGRVYYEHDGQAIRLPRDPALCPTDEYLEWHGDEIFRR
jgi:putative restriction endonuclease